MTRRKTRTRKDPFEGLTQLQIARRFPMRMRLIEKLMTDSRKFARAMEMLRALGYTIKVAPNQWDFDVVPI